MVLSKRERVIRTLELDDEPDVVPIHTLGFERTAKSYQDFQDSDEFSKNEMFIKNSYSKVKYNWAGNITELRFWNSDCHAMDPFKYKVNYNTKPAPPEYPNCSIDTIAGRIFKLVPQQETGKPYLYYVGGYFKTPEILYSHWDEYGKPSECISDRTNYSPKIWDDYVESLAPYVYPMASNVFPLFEHLFEGMTIGRMAYYMRKNPQYIHDVLSEYTKVNLEMIKRLAEAGVDIFFYYDDLGYKGKSIISLENFRKFLLPYYKQIYQECRKHGMFVVQHSCGYVDKLLPDMVDAGLNCIQALEPAAGVDLAHLKETLGDRLCFMGGIDSSGILNFGTPGDIEEEVKRCIKAAGTGGGYIAGPSHSILNVLWENVIALRDAMLKYRKYPLNL
jgi:hypothetical protein